MSNNTNEIRIYISDSKQNKVPIRVQPSDYVSKIIEILKIKKVINGQITLTFNGGILEENEKLDELDITSDCVITCMTSFPAGKKIKQNTFMYFKL